MEDTFWEPTQYARYFVPVVSRESDDTVKYMSGRRGTACGAAAQQQQQAGEGESVTFVEITEEEFELCEREGGFDG